jgi:very-short-patch-repair endonuclease
LSITRSQPIDPSKLELARHFRRNPTPAESHAWSLVRNRRILDLKFRRQQIIDGFLVDLYCPSLRVVLEVDGAIHQDPDVAEYDAIRAERLVSLGVQIVRIPNDALSVETLETILASKMRVQRTFKGPNRRTTK